MIDTIHTIDATDTVPSLVEILTLRAGYNTAVVVLGTTLLGIAAGIVGVFAYLRKRSLMTDALSHATLPGIGAAFLLAVAWGGDGRSLPLLLAGATLSSVLGIVCIQMLGRWTRLREDASIGIVLSVFFGVGIVLLSIIQTSRRGQAAGIDHFILGQTAAMTASDAFWMGAIALLAVMAAIALTKEFSLTCFDEGFARVQGWPVSWIDLGMMSLVVLVTVAGARAVGLLLVVALLIVPAVGARFWTDRMRVLVPLAALLGGLSGYLGSSLSAMAPRQPAGAVIVLVAGALFVFGLLFAPRRGLIGNLVRRLHLELKIAGDHILEAAMVHDPRTAVLGAEPLGALARQRGWSRPYRAMVLLSLRSRRAARRHPGGGVELTPIGREIGARVQRNHRLWEQYLIRYADVAPNHVDWSVDQVEHVLSDDLITELERALEDRGIEIPPRAESAA